jgi:DNA polymerase-3 subunit delta
MVTSPCWSSKRPTRSAPRRARPGFDEREVLVAGSAFNWNDLYHAAGSMSLFAGRKLIDLRLAGRQAGARRRCRATGLLRASVAGCAAAGDHDRRRLARGEGRLGRRGGCRRAVVKLIPPGLAELPAWLAARLARQQQSADAAGLRFIAERVEGNLLAAHQEILKLEILYPSGALRLEQIREAVLNVARYDLDGLREAMLAGDVLRLTRTIDGLQQEGEAPPLVLWAMTEEVRALAQINAGLEARQPLPELLKEARVWGARQGQIRKALQRVNGGRARAALTQAARIDRMIKGLASGDVWNEFLRLGLNIAVA